jgi:hypothetical protein
LLQVAESEFGVFLPTDQGISHQQNLAQIDLGIVIPGHGATDEQI